MNLAVVFEDIEEWTPIIHQDVKPGLYEVSTFGNVRNNKGQYLKPLLINSGYYVYRLYTGYCHPITKNSIYKRILAHRLVL